MTDSLWPGLLIWVALYISDYWCTLTCARMYQSGVREVVAFEGSYELTPYYQKDVNTLRWMSPRFVVALVASIGVLVALWSAGGVVGCLSLGAQHMLRARGGTRSARVAPR